MQPNQQDSSQQTAPSAPLPYQVPDYLHLDPVTGQIKRSNNKFFIIVALCIVCVLLIMGAVIYWQSLQLTSEQRFYQALEKSMETSYLHRDYNLKLTSQNEQRSIVVAVDSDFSDPTDPKSYSQETYAQNLKGAAQRNYTEENAMTNSNNYDLLLKSASTSILGSDLKINQWYSIPVNTAADANVNYILDEIEPQNILNSVQGIILIGNISQAQRTQLMNYIETNGSYPIQNVQNTKRNGTSQTIYTIQLDRDKLNNLNKKAVSLLGLGQRHTIDPIHAQFENLSLWVDDSTGRFTKIEYTDTDKKTVTIDKTITISYPSRLNKLTPVNIKELSF